MKGKVIDLDSPTKDVATPAKSAQSPSVEREEHLKKRKKLLPLYYSLWHVPLQSMLITGDTLNWCETIVL